MSRYLIIVSLPFVLTNGWSQNTNLDYQGAIKISNQTSYTGFSKTSADIDSTLNYTTTTSLQILQPTIAYQWKTKNHNFHEVELTDFSFNRSTSLTQIVGDSIPPASPAYVGIPIGGGKTVNAMISLKYEYIMTFRKMKEKKLVPSLGLAINPFFMHTGFRPALSNDYPKKDQIYGVNFFITPRLTYFISKKIFVDINLPLCLARTYFSSHVEENPVLPLNARRTTTYSFESFPAILSARIGVGIKI